MKYLKKFENAEEYAAFLNSENIAYPNVCLIKGTNKVIYNDKEIVTPTVIYLNQAETSPSAMLTGEINGEQIQLIRNNAHRYLGKNTESGVMTICQLKDSDSDYYYTDEPANVYGSEGDVFMRLPRFAYKVEDEGSDRWKISLVYGSAPDATWIQWDGNDLIGVYKSYVSSNKMYSRKVSPTVSLSQLDYETSATNRGQGFSIVKWKHHCIMALLFYAIYGTTNSQEALGNGGTGYLATSGMSDLGSSVINFCGLIGWWGGHGEWMTGVVANYDTWKISEDDGRERIVAAIGSDGYPLKMVLGKKFDLIPSTIGGSAATGYCDEYRHSTVEYGVLLRSYYKDFTQGGVSYINGNSAPSAAGANHTSRLVFRGTIIEEKNVTAFKNLVEI